MKKFCSVFFFLLLGPAITLASPKEVDQSEGVTVTKSKETNEIKIRGKEAAVEYVARSSIVASYCADPETLYFKVGSQNFAAKREGIDLAQSVVKTVHLTYNKDTDEVELTIPGNFGCQDNPGVYTSIEVKHGASSPMMLSENEGPSSIPAYIEFLNKNNMCRTTKYENVIACIGSRTEQGAKLGVIFMLPITPNGGLYMGTSNIPVHARCEGPSPSELHCVVNEYFEQHFKAALGISLDVLSKEAIIRTREIILNETRKLMVN
jgi:hypothetical protein